MAYPQITVNAVLALKIIEAQHDYEHHTGFRETQHEVSSLLDYLDEQLEDDPMYQELKQTFTLKQQSMCDHEVLIENVKRQPECEHCGKVVYGRKVNFNSYRRAAI
jgi:GTP cyclohydrolase I